MVDVLFIGAFLVGIFLLASFIIENLIMVLLSGMSMTLIGVIIMINSFPSSSEFLSISSGFLFLGLGAYVILAGSMEFMNKMLEGE